MEDVGRYYVFRGAARILEMGCKNNNYAITIKILEPEVTPTN